jgi:hypothetical protein
MSFDENHVAPLFLVEGLEYLRDSNLSRTKPMSLAHATITVYFEYRVSRSSLGESK